MNLTGENAHPNSGLRARSENRDLCELAYAAGYFDGEGTINILSNGEGKGFQLRVEISSCDLDTLRLFKVLFGGSLRSVKWKGLPYLIHRWAINNQDAIRVLGAMVPFLKAKAKEAQLVLDSGWDTLPSGGGRLSESQKRKRAGLKRDLMEVKKQHRRGNSEVPESEFHDTETQHSRLANLTGSLFLEP